MAAPFTVVICLVWYIGCLGYWWNGQAKVYRELRERGLNDLLQEAATEERARQARLN